MKTLKVIFALIFVLNITAAFAEEVSSDCSQIADGNTRISEDSGDADSTPASTSGATGV